MDPRDHGPAEFLTWAHEQGIGAPTVRRLFSALVGQGVHDPILWGRDFQVPRRWSGQFAPLPRLTLERTVTSPVDGFQKLLFRTADGASVETVLLPLLRQGAVSVCL